jgi:uncharacterized membrane protein YbhN (UPF0104 family)
MRPGSVAKALVTLSLLGWFIWYFGPEQLLRALGRASIAWTLAMFLVTVAMLLALAWRWQLLLHGLDVVPRFREVCGATFTGYFLSCFLPSVGGDVVRVSYLAGRGHRTVDLTISIVVDRCLGLLALVLLGIGATLLHGTIGKLQGPILFLYLATIVLLLVVFLVSLSTGAMARWVAPLAGGPLNVVPATLATTRAALGLYRSRKIVLVKALGVSLGSQLLSVIVYYGLAIAVGEKGHFLDFLYGIPAVNLAIVLPISVGGVGVGEWTFVYLFTALGMSPQTALAVSLLNLIVRLGAGLAGGGLYLLRGLPLARPYRAPEGPSGFSR